MHEAKTRLTELVAAVENGERVVITRHGRPAAELILPRKSGLDWAAIAAARAALGIGTVTAQLAPDFDAPLEEAALLSAALLNHGAQE